jgi:filamentous hemagglutinin family protein
MQSTRRGMRKGSGITTWIILGASVIAPFTARASSPGVVLDGSFGASGALPGPNYIITAAMGRQLGSNLFQSFSEFNLTSSESATFTGPSNVQNIIARVTGGDLSSIDGTINSTITGANLFLLNPAGVMFGPNAQVNVTGSFVVGTPDYVKLADGGKFSTHLGGSDNLTSAPVSAFGFLSSTPQAVSFTGSQIGMQPNTGLSVIAGDVTLNGATLYVPAGNLTVFSAASAGEVPFSVASPGSGYAAASFASLGTVSLTNASQALIDSSGGGSVVIRGGKLTVDGSDISSNNYGSSTGGNISVQADQITLSNGGYIATDSFGGADAGSIAIQTTGDLSISGTGSQISADAESTGNGGVVDVVAGGNISLSDGGDIFANTDGMGSGGTVSVQAASLNIGSASGLSSVAASGGGDAGTVDVVVSGALTMTDNGAIAADTYTQGKGGDVNVQALQLNMSGTSVISANTVFGSGQGGNVNVEAGSLSIQGPGYLVAGPNNTMIGLTGITAQSFSSGDAGSVNVDAGSVALSAGAVISTASFGSGKGGPISVSCDTAVLSNDSEISSTSFTDAGSVEIDASDYLQLLGGSTITTSASENGGDITFKIGDYLYLLDSSIQAYAGVFALANQDVGGNGGNILIDPEFVILNNGLISANDFSSTGHDGNITNLSDYFFSYDSTLYATGTIDSTPPDLNLEGSLLVLPSDLVHVERELRERCAAALNHEFSSLIVVGRGGIETPPDELQPDFGLRPVGIGAGHLR